MATRKYGLHAEVCLTLDIRLPWRQAAQAAAVHGAGLEEVAAS